MDAILITKRLTDGSEVYDVELSPETLHAVSSRDALQLIAEIQKTIAVHTLNDTALKER